MRKRTLAGGSAPAGGVLPPHRSSGSFRGSPGCREVDGRVPFAVRFTEEMWKSVSGLLREVAFWSDIPMETEFSPITYGRVFSGLATLLRRTGARVRPGADPLDGMKPDVTSHVTIKVAMHKHQFFHFWSLARELWPWQFDDETKAGLWTLSPESRGQLLFGMATLAPNHARLTHFEYRANYRFLKLVVEARDVATELAGTSCDGKLLLFVCEHFLRADIRGRKDFLRRLGEAARKQAGMQLLSIRADEPYISSRIEAAKRAHLGLTGKVIPLCPDEKGVGKRVRIRHPFLSEEAARIFEAMEQARKILPKGTEDELLELIHAAFFLDHRTDSSFREVVWSIQSLFELKMLGADQRSGKLVTAVRTAFGGEPL